jgi:hypothetical protein
VSPTFAVFNDDTSDPCEVDTPVRECWSEKVVDQSFFPDFVNGMRLIWVQDSTKTYPDRRGTMSCVSLLLAVGLFINSQSFICDDTFLNMLIMEA